MTNDMFRSNSEQLLEFCREGIKSKSEIIAWGLRYYYISSDRVVRKFVEKGIMRKLSKNECDFKGYVGKQAYYEVN